MTFLCYYIFGYVYAPEIHRSLEGIQRLVLIGKSTVFKQSINTFYYIFSIKLNCVLIDGKIDRFFIYFRIFLSINPEKGTKNISSKKRKKTIVDAKLIKLLRAMEDYKNE